MLKLTDANNFRRTLAGLCLIAAPVVYGGADLIRLSVDGGVEEGAEQLSAIAASPGLWTAATLLNMLGIVLFVPAILGLMHLLRERGVVLGHVGGALALIGLLGLAAHNAGYYGFYGAASTSAIDQTQLMPFLEQPNLAVIVYVPMFLIGFLLGPLLLGIGLYRAQSVPRGAAGIIILGMVALIAASFSPAAEIMVAMAACWALLTVGLATTGLRVLAMSDAEWKHLLMAPTPAAAMMGTPVRVQ